MPRPAWPVWKEASLTDPNWLPSSSAVICEPWKVSDRLCHLPVPRAVVVPVARVWFEPSVCIFSIHHCPVSRMRR